MATNTTIKFDLPPLPAYSLRPLPPLISGLPDEYLALALPVVAYWVVSMFFHCIDVWDIFPQYRLHTPAEVLKRNHVTRWEVFRDVVIQQILQTIFGVVIGMMDGPIMHGKEEYDIAWWAQKIRIAQRAIPVILATFGFNVKALAGKVGSSHSMLAGFISGGVYPQLTESMDILGQHVLVPTFAPWEMLAAKFMYHVVMQAIQFFIAIVLVDTWQYCWHRAMHINKWLYVNLHSRHHRLYVPYAYGALYNHPIEGFVMDIFGTGMAYLLVGMTVRQSMWFFTMSTIKTIDDHCGYDFPWDPLQLVTSNNAAYHDIHHQSWGIKTNFSQPFFTVWDSILGTKWTGGDVSARYEKARVAAQKKADADVDMASPDIDDIADSDLYKDEASNATSTARTAQVIAEPKVPSGKATLQAIASRQQVLDDHVNGGISVIAEESMEELKARGASRRSTRKKSASAGLKGLAGRVGDSFHGKGTGVLGVDSNR